MEALTSKNNNFIPKERISFVDIAKGICMLMVVLIHTIDNISTDGMSDMIIIRYIKTIYMPCFFLLSGFFIKKEDFVMFFKKKFKTLLLPLIIMYSISMILCLICNIYFPQILKNSFDVLALLKSDTFTNGPLWFLSALFFALLINQLIFRINNEIMQLFLCVIVLVIGFYWLCLFKTRLPLYIDSALVASFFVFIGRYLKVIIYKIRTRRTVLLLGGLFTIFTMLFPQKIEMHYNIYDINIFGTIIISTIGSLGVILLSKALEKNKALEIIGLHSVIFLCFHMYYIIVCSHFLSIIIDNIVIRICSCFILSICSVVLSIPIIKKIFNGIF